MGPPHMGWDFRGEDYKGSSLFPSHIVFPSPLQSHAVLIRGWSVQAGVSQPTAGARCLSSSCPPLGSACPSALQLQPTLQLPPSGTPLLRKWPSGRQPYPALSQVPIHYRILPYLPPRCVAILATSGFFAVSPSAKLSSPLPGTLGVCSLQSTLHPAAW